jgi:hypothetical protein
MSAEGGLPWQGRAALGAVAALGTYLVSLRGSESSSKQLLENVRAGKVQKPEQDFVRHVRDATKNPDDLRALMKPAGLSQLDLAELLVRYVDTRRASKRGGIL